MPPSHPRALCRTRRALFSFLAVLPLGIGSARAEEKTTIFIEAETAGATEAGAPGWTTKELAGASGGKTLFEPSRIKAESAAIPVTIPRAGAYRIWVRYFRAAPTSPGMFVLLRDEEGEEAAFHFCDWYDWLPTETPYEKPKPLAGERSGFVWESFDATIERPMAASLVFGSYPTYGIKYAGGQTDRQVDCLLLTTDKSLDPEKLEVPSLAALATAAPVEQKAPAGFTISKGVPAVTTFFDGMADPLRRFQAGLINNGSYFIDPARAVRMGFNRDHSLPSGDLIRHGVLTQGHIENYSGDALELRKAYPSPTGRFVNAEGLVSASFSFNFPPVAESSVGALERNVRRELEHKDSAAFGAWRISDESGGLLDYSPDAQAAFRQWLAGKHGTIATLNERWGAEYHGFEEIVPPANFEAGHAAWLEFRAFSGRSYTEAIGRQLPVIRRLDPQQRPLMGANSNLDFFTPYFSRIRPIDFDEFVNVALAGEKFVSWDTYCADDQLGAETDLITNFADGTKKPIVQEWSNHCVDPRIAARSYWTFVSKGVAGVFLFMFHEGFHATYPKWALLDERREPKAKLAAYSDAAQEVHRLEPLLMAAHPVHAVKPVALYWSRIDLSLAEPHESLYGCALDSPFHIYEALRGQGYAVRFITPRQIAAGGLSEVGALVLADCNHIPGDAAKSIEAWVRGGGVVIGDRWPGGWDEYARPQSTLAAVFGVRAAAGGQQPGSSLALQESKQGYGEVTDAAVVQKNYYEKIDELAQQPYAVHPLARAFGDLMLSGVNLDRVECVAGHVIAMSHRGRPGLVVNDYGRGKALYSSILLGTLYESGGTRYEWDTTHSGLSFAKILDDFLKYAGVQPSCTVAGLAPRVRAKVRVESPLVTPEGNFVIGLTSLNDDAVGAFDLGVELPAGAARGFSRVFAVTQGSRQLQPVAVTIAGSQMKLRMPSFDTHAAIVALQDSQPLVGLKLTGVERGIAGLATIGTGQAFEVEATVYNPSPRKFAAGELRLTIPAGWLQSAEAVKLESIEPGGEGRCTFQVRSPDLAAAKRILPLVAHYQSGSVKSSPTTEMVWWGATAPTPHE
ncbi:MAG TPA: beta-galactosidase [Chthoniobacteraceae bacterium]|jgi:hypothetical protein|nr:beta-galactosidase [Chthoniobacteraceae bacterium]